MNYGRNGPYVSPFVADALYRAKLRGLQAGQKKKAAKAKRELEEAEWNSNIRVNPLFDPNLFNEILKFIALKIEKI